MFMEYFYLESAREMLDHGDWITPIFNETNRFDKPILFYWMVMLAFKVLGTGLGAGRLVSAVMALGVIGLTYGLGKSLYGIPAARWAVLVLITTPLFVLFARTAIPDLTLTFFLTLALFAFQRGVASSPPRRSWLYLFYAAAALATLTKGPLAILLLGLVIAGFFLAWKERPSLRALAPGSGIGIFLAIFLPWFVLIVMKHGQAYLDYIWSIQQKAAVGEARYAWHFYLRHFFWDFLPWSPLVAAGLGIFWRHRRDLTAEKQLPVPWLIFILVFFSLVSLKAIRYLLPLTPAFALLAGWFLARATGPSGTFEPKALRLVAWTTAGLGLLGGGLLAALLTSGGEWTDHVSGAAFIWPVLLGINAAAGLVAAARQSTHGQTFGIAGVAAVGLLAYFSLVPGLSGPSPAAALAGRINYERPPGTSLGVYRMEVNEWVYEVGPPVVSLTGPQDLERFQAAHPSALIVMTPADYEKAGAKRTVVAKAARPKRLRWKADASGPLLSRLEQDREDFYLTAGPVPVDR
ncbi:MAG TPA: glycosyltransferase family 39 protein [Nitrospiria bacterium]|jgi:4-amino-4-deoxy-L-arabinose transferase-like glycosyltransferase|nr:glycosyltransferase family 39 protein [Nitrospiria bacterium]